MKGDKVVALCDRNCNVIAPMIFARGNKNESPLMREAMGPLKSMAKAVGFNIKGSTMSLDGVYDCRKNRKKIFNLSRRALPLDYALGVAEDWARKQTTKSAWARKDAAWRTQPATQKQKEALSKCGIYFDEDISKGRASQLLDSKFNEPATVKQVCWLRANGVNITDNMTKMEARKMISGRAHQARR